MKLDSKTMRLYIVTDRTWLNGNKLSDQVEAAVRAGATFVQLREKDLSYEEFLEQAREIKAVTDNYGVPFVINDNIDIAIAADADGVHIGQDDMSYKEARRRLGPDKIIGVSVHNIQEAEEAEKNGADYLGVGAVFPTSTKLDAGAVALEILKGICDSVSIPVVAIGGITKDNIMELNGQGADGAAVVSAVFAQEDIEAAAGELRRLSDKIF